MLDALVLTIGRLVKIVPMLLVAGAAPAKKTARPSSSTVPTSIGLLLAVPVGIVLVVGGLTFSSALALCSVAGHVALRWGVFIGLLVGVGLLFGGLTFFPALILEPGPNTWRQPPHTPDWGSHQWEWTLNIGCARTWLRRQNGFRMSIAKSPASSNAIQLADAM